MDADAQARQLLDRMAIDFAQMVKDRMLITISSLTVADAIAGSAQIATTRKRSDSLLQRCAGLLSDIELSKPSFARRLSS